MDALPVNGKQGPRVEQPRIIFAEEELGKRRGGKETQHLDDGDGRDGEQSPMVALCQRGRHFGEEHAGDQHIEGYLRSSDSSFPCC